LIERTPSDARETMIDGDSGLLHVGPVGNRPRWEPARGRLVWPNGAIARVFTAAEPDKVRGFQSDLLWCEELASWAAPETYEIARFGLRLGYAKALVTTTPKPIDQLKKILRQPGVAITKGRTLDNIGNLSPAIRLLVEQYAGTRLGRQELEAELLEDVEGALWKRDWIDARRVSAAPELARVVVAIDPAVTSEEGSDETGIIALGRGVDRRGYVLGDRSGRYSPDGWARRAVALLEELEADYIVAEANNGGEMVKHTLHVVDRSVRVKLVHASRGKLTRAEPCAAAYERGTVSHVGSFPALEDQLCEWEPGSGRSPDRLDALVWAWSELFPRVGFAMADALAAMEGARH